MIRLKVEENAENQNENLFNRKKTKQGVGNTILINEIPRENGENRKLKWHLTIFLINSYEITKWRDLSDRTRKGEKRFYGFETPKGNSPQAKGKTQCKIRAWASQHILALSKTRGTDQELRLWRQLNSIPKQPSVKQENGKRHRYDLNTDVTYTHENTKDDIRH